MSYDEYGFYEDEEEDPLEGMDFDDDEDYDDEDYDDEDYDDEEFDDLMDHEHFNDIYDELDDEDNTWEFN